MELRLHALRVVRSAISTFPCLSTDHHKVTVLHRKDGHLSLSFPIITQAKSVKSKHELVCGNKTPTRCNRGFYCRSYCSLNMFRAPLCPSSGAQEYYTVVAACGISCGGFQVAGLVWSWGLCVRFAGYCFTAVKGYVSGLQDAALVQ